jgi:hypothetical protein
MSDGIDIGTLGRVFRGAFAESLAEDREKRLKWEREQWPYTLGTVQQEINLARDAGLLGRKEEEGLQDDLDNTFHMFTDITPEGALKEGLQGRHGGPAPLMELYETMDLRGVIWNYGLGWLSSLKGGWNIEIDKAESKTKDLIDKLIDERLRVANASPEEVLNYMEASDKLDFYSKTREMDLKMKLDMFYRTYNNFYSDKKPEKDNQPIIYWGRNKRGELVPKIKNVKVSKGSRGSMYLAPMHEEESQTETSTNKIPEYIS